MLQIGADRSKRGILFPGSAASRRQQAYARTLGTLDSIGFSRVSDGATEYSVDGFHVRPTNSMHPLLYGFDALRVARTLPKPDVVSAQDTFETGLVALIIARKFGVPLHVQVHTDFLSPEYARLSMMNQVRVWMAGFVLRRASRIRVVSERIRDGIVSRYGITSTVSVLPIFVPAPKYVLLESDFETTLLWIGRLEKEKNPALAIRALAAVREAGHTAVGLRIVGAGSEEATLWALREELGLVDWVQFYPETTDMSPHFSIADLVLVTSVYEGYGMAIMEARRMGKPVLSTDVGIAKQVGAIIAKPEEFADALGRWLDTRPPTPPLRDYPYDDFDGFVRAYCDDIVACVAQ